MIALPEDVVVGVLVSLLKFPNKLALGDCGTDVGELDVVKAPQNALISLLRSLPLLLLGFSSLWL